MLILESKSPSIKKVEFFLWLLTFFPNKILAGSAYSCLRAHQQHNFHATLLLSGAILRTEYWLKTHGILTILKHLCGQGTRFNKSGQFSRAQLWSLGVMIQYKVQGCNFAKSYFIARATCVENLSLVELIVFEWEQFPQKK